jgi:5'-deoxynucleotidase YfbR-like HD superfamily hydrolase
MKEKLNFLIEIQKLKEIPRTGWLPFKKIIKNPETTIDHTFRVAFSAWLLGAEKKLDIERSIKIALSHDLCEVYVGDITPFFYYDLNHLPKVEKRKKEILSKWVRLPEKEKRKRGKIKFEKEKKGLLKLIKILGPDLRKEFFLSWLDCEKGLTKNGRFVKQLDRIDILLQSLEYFGPNEKISGTGWWEATEEIIEDPLLLDFLNVIQEKFYRRASKEHRRNKKLASILDLLLKIGKLKRMPRLYWVLREIKNPETVASHIVTLAIMAWIFGKERKELNQEKLLKMALCHELSAVYTGDTTPYDRILPKNENERKKVLKKMIRLSKKEKEWIFLADYKAEKKAIEKLTKKLDSSIKREILQLWHDYRTRVSPEAKFLSQLNILAVLLQGLLYEKKYKEFSAAPLWEWAFENCDDEICVSLMDEMKKKFYG